METLTYLSELASELGLDRSNMRKYVLKKGINFLMARDPVSRQTAMAFTAEEAEKIRSFRSVEGFNKTDSPVILNGEIGVFYIIRLVPELDSHRIKLGFSNDMTTRLASHRTSSPTAELIKFWDCKRSWERAAMDSATRCGCRLIANEVFQCDSEDETLARLEDFFSLMPKVR